MYLSTISAFSTIIFQRRERRDLGGEERYYRPAIDLLNTRSMLTCLSRLTLRNAKPS
jgi:hypothetical protein